MITRTLLLTLTATLANLSLSAADHQIAKAADGSPILSPVSKVQTETNAGGTVIKVPAGMALVPAGPFDFGDGSTASKIDLPAFFIGKYEVTNAEYKAFLDANKSRQAPKYWKGGKFPEGKDNHPVLFISFKDAEAYCQWISKETGYTAVVPSAEQWEKAARGPKGGKYPWGNDKGATLSGGKLKSRFNYNAVCAAYYLEKQPDLLTEYTSKSQKAGEKVAIRDIAGSDGRKLAVSADGGVTGWIDHKTNTGFVNTVLYRNLVDDEGGFTTPVGSFEDGKSPYGCYDMAGNAYEWTSSIITATNGAERGKEVNDVRGGSWYSTGRSGMSLFTGEGRAPNSGYHSVGFRIAILIPQGSR
jgi:formylglycine-generating enzyme required for sulfatase activity